MGTRLMETWQDGRETLSKDMEEQRSRRRKAEHCQSREGGKYQESRKVKWNDQPHPSERTFSYSG